MSTEEIVVILAGLFSLVSLVVGALSVTYIAAVILIAMAPAWFAGTAAATWSFGMWWSISAIALTLVWLFT